MRYFGTDTNISIPEPDDANYVKAFETAHLREFAFQLSREIVVEAITVRGIGSSGDASRRETPFTELGRAKRHGVQLKAATMQKVFIDGSWVNAPVHRLTDDLQGGIAEVDITAAK